MKIFERIGAVMLGLAFLLTASEAPAANEAAAFSAIHLTAQAAIQAGELAQARASSAEIRNLGRLVVRDDTELDRRLLGLAAKAGVQLADSPKPGEMQLAELGGLRGAIFDRKFLNFNYGASEALLKQMHDAAGQLALSPLMGLVAIFAPIIRQDQFLSGWCLGHCVPRTKP